MNTNTIGYYLMPNPTDSAAQAPYLPKLVMDVGTQHMGEIHGTDEFMILGNGITLDGENESAKLLDRKTGEVLATAEVSTVSKGQRATCAFAAVPGGIAKGAYVLEVTTFGLVGETTPRVFRKPVTLVEPIPAPVSPVRIDKVRYDRDAEKPGDAMSLATGQFSAFGENLKSGDDEPTVKVEAKTADGEWTEMPVDEIAEATATEIYVILDGLPFSEDEYVKFRVTVTNALGSDVHEGNLI